MENCGQFVNCHTLRADVSKYRPEVYKSEKSPQRALRADQNGDHGKFELVLKASLERP